MSVPEHEVAAGRAPARPQPGAPAGAFDDALVVDALTRLAGAASRAGASDAVLPLLLEVPGVRAAAVVLRDGGRVLVAGSAGYDCGTMAPGAELPLDAGLPITEAVRTGRTVLQGSGPSWVAMPFSHRAGGLLLSLTGPPPEAPSELTRLHRVARGLGDALARARTQENASAELAVVSAQLAPPAPAAGVTVRSLAYQGPVGGDVALCLPDAADGRWLVVADVCGSGLAAAVVASSVQATLTALASYADGPAALLRAADRALRACAADGAVVTAVVVHERAGRLRVASAAHPPLLLLSPSGVTTVEVEPGRPLALDGEQPCLRAEVEVPLPDDAVLLLHTDGLADRRLGDGTCTADVPSLVAGLPLDDLEELADAVLAAAQARGAQGDDVTLLLARPQG